jgi:hypothetical protein
MGDKESPPTLLEGAIMICDWCGEKYPISYSNNKNFHQLKNYANKPLICHTCYQKMKQTNTIKIYPNTQIQQKTIEIKMRTKT